MIVPCDTAVPDAKFQNYLTSEQLVMDKPFGFEMRSGRIFKVGYLSETHLKLKPREI